MHSTGWLDLKYTHNVLFGEKNHIFFFVYQKYSQGTFR